ncbi:MAG: ornithine carbamoyltransferase [Synergistaceae bacterium]|nr:ornithine carbamoyltransferase [Synergistaceae bacterium]
MQINLQNRNLLTLKNHTPMEIEYLLNLAEKLKIKKKKGIYGSLLSGKNIALIFEKPSTRTRCSFTVAVIDEGGHPEFLGKNDIQLGHKEDIKDTARVLGRLFDGIQYRGFSQDNLEELAKYAGVPVWNGLTDEYHPTQVLADLLTIKENFGHLNGLKFAFIGDGRNNVANSLMIGAVKMGMNFSIGTPKILSPSSKLLGECLEMANTLNSGSTIEITEDPFIAVKNADIIYTDVWVSMGEDEKEEDRKKMLAPYQVNMDLIRATSNPNVIFLHCLPAVKGEEVTEEVFESKYAKQFDEAENRMHTIKAVMVASICKKEELL